MHLIFFLQILVHCVFLPSFMNSCTLPGYESKLNACDFHLRCFVWFEILWDISLFICDHRCRINCILYDCQFTRATKTEVFRYLKAYFSHLPIIHIYLEILAKSCLHSWPAGFFLQLPTHVEMWLLFATQLLFCVGQLRWLLLWLCNQSHHVMHNHALGARSLVSPWRLSQTV